MKKGYLLILAALLFAACGGKKTGAKAMLDSVIKIHDKVMTEDEQLTKNKMELDTLLKQDKFTGTDSTRILDAKLAAADSAMDKWMHDFDPDQTGKSDEQALKYMTLQKQQITRIDAQLNKAVSESTGYLLKRKTK